MKSSFPVSLLGNIMEPTESVRNLGVILDADNAMPRHIANFCFIYYYPLRGTPIAYRSVWHLTQFILFNISKDDSMTEWSATSAFHILALISSDKTEFIIFGSKRQRDKLKACFPIDILGNSLCPADSVKNLGCVV